MIQLTTDSETLSTPTNVASWGYCQDERNIITDGAGKDQLRKRN